MWLDHPSPKNLEDKYRQSQITYDAVRNAPVTTLSNVNFYWQNLRRGRGYIYYRPGGRRAGIRCIRCEINWSKIRAQIGELDFVTLPTGDKVAVELRLKTGKTLMPRKMAVEAAGYVRDHYHKQLIDPEGRRSQNGFSAVLSAIFALILTGLYALTRWSERKKSEVVAGMANEEHYKSGR
ncbi:MAG TPA: hypothetical protein VN110_01825 [Sphingobium sp.]|nr:hypothetical protein [Sphingobium sp.]